MFSEDFLEIAYITWDVCTTFDSPIDIQRDSEVEIYYCLKNILKAEKEHLNERY